MTEKKDVYSRVTDKIVAMLEQGVRPWVRPWNADHLDGRIMRPLRHNGLPYQGINVLTLWAESLEKGYAAPTWMSFKQALDLGGHVRKGERGSLVVYASTLHRSETDTITGEETERDIPFMKGYTVFNVEQIDGLPKQYTMKPQAVFDAPQRIERADAFLHSTGADIRHGGNRAYYTQGEDYIRLPHFETFADPESYYATAAHELTHWTKHAKRLDRDFGRKRWGDEGYAMEELVAELGAAFLCADLELTPEVREGHADYIADWLKVLKADNRAVFSAAAHAQKAVAYLRPD